MDVLTNSAVACLLSGFRDFGGGVPGGDDHDGALGESVYVKGFVGSKDSLGLTVTSLHEDMPVYIASSDLKAYHRGIGNLITCLLSNDKISKGVLLAGGNGNGGGWCFKEDVSGSLVHSALRPTKIT
ncbi:hypothetical protein VKT23_014755 [Stygiomarasmius scandens]|uniref:Uncharacterized protein n=1 Tax=Marasmiellus scandens TaxID=2682957 RepID=A0ABR1J307_9AGAR